MRSNATKRKLMAGDAVIGVNVQIDHPWLVELIGAAGFDFVMLDGEHGAAYNNLPTLIMAADAAGVTPIVRVPDHGRAHLLWALESGAAGVQVPMVDTPEQAQALVFETKYAPVGGRGFSNATRAAGYGVVPTIQHADESNRETLLIVQIETVQALERAAEIAAVPGVDMIFIGPADLAQSMGYAGQSKAPEVIAAMTACIAAVRDMVPVGISAFDGDEVRFWRERGASSILTGSMHRIRRAFEGLHEDLRTGL